VASRKGLSAAAAARKFHIEKSTTETSRIFEDDEVNAVVIATRHDSHARLVVEALRAGKSVFVEKPLCLSAGELEQIIQAYQQAQVEPRPPILMVGYNRRFAPLVHSLRQLLAGRQAPLAMIFTCNAGPLAADHWIHDPAAGGGRIVGEACHFIDLLHFLADQSPIVRVAALRHGPDEPANLNDTVSVTLRMADGSLGQINYFANGSKRYPKERLEVFCDGRVLAIDNFRRLRCYGPGKGCRLWTQDKGHDEEIRQFIEAVRSGVASPIPLESLVHTTRATLAAVESLQSEKILRPEDLSA